MKSISDAFTGPIWFCVLIIMLCSIFMVGQLYDIGSDVNRVGRVIVVTPTPEKQEAP